MLIHLPQAVPTAPLSTQRVPRVATQGETTNGEKKKGGGNTRRRPRGQEAQVGRETQGKLARGNLLPKHKREA